MNISDFIAEVRAALPHLSDAEVQAEAAARARVAADLAIELAQPPWAGVSVSRAEFSERPCAKASETEIVASLPNAVSFPRIQVLPPKS